MNTENKKVKAPRNRTITLNSDEIGLLRHKLYSLTGPAKIDEVLGKIIHQDFYSAVKFLPENSVDLIFADPPYNLTKTFGDVRFSKIPMESYNEYIDSWLAPLIRLLKPHASVYICGDWRSSASINITAQKHLKIINRITWEREKGRGAKKNWKSSSEDIWFCTVSDKYTFNVEDVKLKRRVMAPYKTRGKPKDWSESSNGNFRNTHPSNIWTDISVPYWSMPENTDHPTQKPEKLLAKIILASTNKGDVVFDPFLGSGTTPAVAKKLGRKYFGIESDETYALIAQKRLQLAEKDKSIQGYHDGIFWERNTLSHQKNMGQRVKGRRVKKKQNQKKQIRTQGQGPEKIGSRTK